VTAVTVAPGKAEYGDLLSKGRSAMKKGIILVTAASALVLGACSANRKAIHIVDRIETTSPVIVSVDAKQRAIISNPYGTASKPNAAGTSGPSSRFCSEPSPDVFSVVAQALSVGGSFGQSADPATIEAALNLAFSDSENGATIARTQSTNLLRELMFRTCERYMNGAIDELEMSVQASRDQKMILAILAIEQLTGAVTPRPVIIGSASSGTAGASGDAIIAYEDARKSLEATEKAAATAQKNYDETNGTDKICEADPVADDNKAKCTEAKTALAKTKADRAAAAERHQTIGSLARAGGVSVSTANTFDAQGGVLGVQPESIEAVADAVTDIVSLNSKSDEFLFFCIKAFSDLEFLKNLGQIDKNGTIQSKCIEYVSAGISSDAKQRFNADLFGREVSSLKENQATDFVAFWDRAAVNGKLDAAKIKAAIAAAPVVPVGNNKVTLERLARATSKDEAQRLFGLLTYGWQRMLAGRTE
jgi:hypothetical protein